MYVKSLSLIALVCTKYFIVIIQHDDLLGCRINFINVYCETTWQEVCPTRDLHTWCKIEVTHDGL